MSYCLTFFIGWSSSSEQPPVASEAPHHFCSSRSCVTSRRVMRGDWTAPALISLLSWSSCDFSSQATCIRAVYFAVTRPESLRRHCHSRGLHFAVLHKPCMLYLISVSSCRLPPIAVVRAVRSALRLSRSGFRVYSPASSSDHHLQRSLLSCWIYRTPFDHRIICDEVAELD